MEPQKKKRVSDSFKNQMEQKETKQSKCDDQKKLRPVKPLYVTVTGVEDSLNFSLLAGVNVIDIRITCQMFW
jgi:hypothetical protein